MKAIQVHRYGGPEHLKLEDVAVPTPKDSEVRIKVKASSVNPLDWRLMRAAPQFIRFFNGLFKPKSRFMGADVAGVVDEIGKDVTRFKVGDEVFGDVFSSGNGAYAEYVCTTENAIALKPSNISFDEAGGVGVAGITGYQAIIKQLKVQPGDTLLINGASGGVGTFALQVAKAVGAEVTAVCSGRNVELMKSLGADHVVDYTQDDFTKQGKTYDHVLEIILNHSRSDYRQILKPGGTCLVTGFTDSGVGTFLKFMNKKLSRKEKKTIRSFTAKLIVEDFEDLAKMMENGSVKTVIDRKYPLEETPEAIAYVETWRARGKVVIVV